MPNQKLIAYCGLTCTDCEAYKATLTNDLALARKTAAAWSAQFHIDVPVDSIWCDGCTVGGRKCGHCGECEIRACARKRELETCAQCGEYPCATLGGLLAAAPTAKTTLDGLRSV